MHFGNIIPPPPVTYACAVSPAAVFPGDPVTVTGTATNLNPKKTATYTWSADRRDGERHLEHRQHRHQDAGAGTYNVKGHVTEGKKPARWRTARPRSR